MLGINKINPMVRAIGTVGAVAALVGGITFAQLTSNTVALSPNNLTTDTASLAIGPGTTCPGDTPTITPGFDVTNLQPTVPKSVDFCIDNTSDFSMTIGAAITSVAPLTGSTAAQDTTLDVSCPTLGADLTAPLSTWGPASFATAIPAGTTADCTATVTLAGSYTGSGGEVVPEFDINFAGTQVEQQG